MSTYLGGISMRSFGLFVVAVLTAVLFAYPATANAASVVATINGGGTAIMDPSKSDFGLAGTTSFGIHATLYSDGTARGHINCVDQVGSTAPGNIFGKVTSWEGSLDGSITLNVVGKLVGFPGGHPQDVSFTVTIQRFGGAGVGQWTLSAFGATVCFETLLSGQIVMRRS
ncbi:MAG: hypothetical protein ACRDKU_07670 [Gaiellaceae bacterium]